MASTTAYGDRLRAAIESSGKSVRQVAKELSERTGNSLEDERSSLYRYLKTQEPSLERAGHLAEILDADGLRDVTPIAARRRGRLAELEAEVGRLRQEFDDFVRAATERMAALEAAPATATPRSARRSTRRQQGGAS